jgi:hypothetical protein
MRKYLVLLLVVAVAMIGTFTAKANAEDGITPFAQINLFAGYIDRSKEQVGAPQNAKDRDFVLQTCSSGQSKFGVKAVKGNLTTYGDVSYISNNPGPAIGVGTEKVTMNEIWAAYKMDAFEIKFGRYIAPYAGYNPWMDAIDGAAMAFEASSYDSYTQQIKFSYMGAYVDLMTPLYGTSSNGSVLASNFYAAAPPPRNYTDSTFPKIAVGYVSPTPVAIGAHFVYQSIKIDNPALAYNGKKVTSYSLNANVNGMVPGVPLRVHANAFYSVNQGDMGFYSRSYTVATPSGTDLKDTKGMGGNVGVAYTVDKLTPAAGLGYESFKKDISGAKKDTALFYFVSCAYQLDNGIKFVPELKVNDYQKDGSAVQVKQGKTMWYGVEFVAVI